jgi:hypothetical protein
MPVDPSISLGAGNALANAPNPLDQVGKIVGVSNALLQNQRGQQQLGLDQSKAIGTVAMSVLNLPDQQLLPALHDAIDRGVSSGVFTPQQAQKWFDGIGASQDPQHLRQMITSAGLQALDPQGQFSQVFGSVQGRGNGQSTQYGVQASPMMGGNFTPVGAAVQQYPPRSELMTRTTTGYDAQGNPISGPIGNVTPATLGGPALQDMGNGRYTNLPPALRNPNAAPAGGNGNVTGQGPATTAALTNTGGSGANNFNTISQAGKDARSRDALLANMQSEVANFIPGPGAEGLMNAKRAISTTAQRLGFTIPGIDDNKIGAQESFNKMVNMIADAQGAGSDQRLAVTQAANPSAHLSAQGINTILGQLRGNEQYLQARAALAAQYPNKADSQSFEAGPAKMLDPRAFQYAAMPPDQKAAFLKGFKSQADRDAVKRSYLFAQQNGLINGQ